MGFENFVDNGKTKGNVRFKIIRRKKTTKKGYDKFETDGSMIVCCIDIVNELMELVFGKE